MLLSLTCIVQENWSIKRVLRGFFFFFLFPFSHKNYTAREREVNITQERSKEMPDGPFFSACDGVSGVNVLCFFEKKSFFHVRV